MRQLRTFMQNRKKEMLNCGSCECKTLQCWRDDNKNCGCWEENFKIEVNNQWFIMPWTNEEWVIWNASDIECHFSIGNNRRRETEKIIIVNPENTEQECLDSIQDEKKWWALIISDKKIYESMLNAYNSFDNRSWEITWPAANAIADAYNKIIKTRIFFRAHNMWTEEDPARFMDLIDAKGNKIGTFDWWNERTLDNWVLYFGDDENEKFQYIDSIWGNAIDTSTDIPLNYGFSESFRYWLSIQQGVDFEWLNDLYIEDSTDNFYYAITWNSELDNNTVMVGSSWPNI